MLMLTVWGAVAAVAFAILAAFIVLAAGGLVARRQVLLLSAGGIAWGVVIARSGELAGAAVPACYAVEFLLLYAWYAFVHRLLRGPYGQSMPEIVRRLLRLFWLALLAVSALIAWVTQDAESAWAGRFFALVDLAAALVGLGLAAQLSRDAPVEGPSALRAFVLAAALACGSQAVLMALLVLAAIPLQAVGLSALVLAMAALLVLYGIRQQPQWSLDIFVSPEARNYAPRFLILAVMFTAVLLSVPVAGFSGARPERLLAVIPLLLAGAVLTTLLFSERLNARLRVFVSKHFLPFRYDYREEWLRLIDTLVSPASAAPLPERVIQAVAQIVGSPAGLLWTRRGDGGAYVCTATWNSRLWSEEAVPADDPALQFMLDRQWIIDTAELTRRPELYGGLQRPAWLEPFPERLLVVPLISTDSLTGFMVLVQSGSAFQLTFEEIDLLRTSGRQVAAFLAQYEADQKLADARQFEAFNRLTAFVMHDLKNLIAQQSLMVSNAARHKGNPDFFEDAMATIENSVARMSKLLQQLQSGDAAGPRQRTRVSAVLLDAVERCRGRDPQPVVEDDTGERHIWIDRERLTTVVAHLVRNAQEATRRDGLVRIRAEAEGDGVSVRIEDDGCGMDQEFIRTRLFRPFDTTKGSKGMGIGVYQARTFVADAGGTLRVESEPGRGTRFTIWLPTGEAPGETPAP